MGFTFGLMIDFDGHEYFHYFNGIQKYKIGQMVCEALNFDLIQLKDYILDSDFYEMPYSSHSVDDMLADFGDYLKDRFDLVNTCLILREMITSMKEFNSEDTKLNHLVDEYHIFDTLFTDTCYEEFGNETIGQLYLSALFNLMLIHVQMIESFSEYVENKDMKDIPKIFDLFYHSKVAFPYQRIQCRILGLTNEFKFFYVIEDILSLILFEIKNCIENNVTIRKCKKCKKFYVVSHDDELYCNSCLENNINH